MEFKAVPLGKGMGSMLPQPVDTPVIEAFIQRYQNQKLLEAINDAYDDLPDRDEQAVRHQMRQRHGQLVDGQW
jgi:hypothetical protein